MAKGRMLQNRISKSRKLSELSSDTARLLYTWMLSHLDQNGCFYADPIMVKNLVFTRLEHSIKTITAILDELAEKKLIIRYEIEGEQYLQYPDFEEKQPGLRKDREGSSEIPAPTPESLRINSGNTPAILPHKIREEKLKEEKIKYADSVQLFSKEYETLISEYGDSFTKACISTLNDYKMAKGKQYKSDYHAIRSWVVDKVKEKQTPHKYKKIPKVVKKICPKCNLEVDELIEYREGVYLCPACLRGADPVIPGGLKEIMGNIGKVM